MLDPFQVLGIDQDATNDEVHRAYRKKAAKHHPDAGGDAWAFKCVQQAYDQIIRSRQPKQPKPTRPKQTPNSGPTQAKRKSQANSKSQTKPQPKAKTKTKTKTNQNSKHRPEPTPKAKPRSAAPTGATGAGADSAEGNGQKSSSSSSRIPFSWRHLLTGHLPLQTEVSVFILVGVLDIVMTNLLLRHGAVEANPIARFFLHNWGFRGMIAFKMVTITFVILIAQIVAQYKMSSAKRLLYLGTAIVGFVVCYSTVLLLKKL